MYYTAYTSKAVKFMETEDLMELLIHSRNRNSYRNITGMMLYHDGVFIQILEGDKADVVSLVDKISNDERHTDFTVLAKGEYPSRCFDHWAMGFSSADAPILAMIKGYKNPGDGNIIPDSHTPENHQVLLLLSEFSQAHSLSEL